jgi:HlyD family secretion protein
VAAGVSAVLFARARGREALKVDVDRVVRREVFRSYVTASGEIVATRYADIGSSVMGRLVELSVSEGGRVRAGQVLARIDSVQADSESRAAAAVLQALESESRAAAARDREAQQSLNRVRTLNKQGLLAESELDSAQAVADATQAQARSSADRVSQARAQLRRAHDVLAKTAITSPMAGVVTRLSVREGEMVVVGVQNQPGTILMTVSDLSSINAEVKVAEADVLRLRQGQTASVTLEAVPGREYGGRVVEVGASALPIVGTGAAAREFRIVIRLDQPDPALRPGLTCDARILTDEVKGTSTVPLQAVVLRPAPDGAGERPGVFVLEGRKVRLQPVDTGIIGGLDVEVRGLSEGITVVVGPFQALRELKDGATVRPNAPLARR